MIENSKGKTVNPAVVEHMAMENERLREALEGMLEYFPEGASDGECFAVGAARAALSQQAEPAPAQDEREAFALWSVTHTNSGCTDTSGIHAFKAGAAWQRARPAQTEQRPSATQQILDLILEQCRYWHGRDEARRGGFACLYAAAKEVADNAAPVSQPAQTELVEALRSFVSLSEQRLHELGELSPEMTECLRRGRAAMAAQGGE